MFTQFGRGVVLSLCVAVAGSGSLALSAGGDKVAFGTLRCVEDADAKVQAINWLKEVGKGDEASLKTFEAAWSTDRPLLDKLADAFALGSPEAAKLLADARDAGTPAPVEVPAILKDAKLPTFFRANLALAYAKALSGRRIFEEARDAIQTAKPDQVVDPSSYFFYKGVAEHALLQKEEASKSLASLMDDVADAPARHQRVAGLMMEEMKTWKEKDLGWIGRKMQNIERRLDLARGGPKTQKMQREVVARLDEIIKRMEEEKKNKDGKDGKEGKDGKDGKEGDDSCRGPKPKKDSTPGGEKGEGKVTNAKLQKIGADWGKLPQRERDRIRAEIIQELPAHHREVIENYFRKLAKASMDR